MIPVALQLAELGVSCVHDPALSVAPTSVTVYAPEASVTVTSFASPSAAANDRVEPATDTEEARAGLEAARKSSTAPMAITGRLDIPR